MSAVHPIQLPLPAHVVERFWSHVTKASCWIFHSRSGKAHHEFGYMRFGIDHRMIYAHRVAWMIEKGEIPPGLQVLHNCPDGDNPACVNPDHLFLGTQGDNVRDCYHKGRDRSELKGSPGSTNPFSVLTEENVRQIRIGLAAGIRQTVLARQYNVCRQAIWSIAHGRGWTHVV